MVNEPARPARDRAWKYSGSVSTPSLFMRLASTAALLALGALMSLLMIQALHRTDSRVGGFVVFLLGVWSLITLLALPQIWRPSAEWRRQRYEARRLERRLRASFEPSKQTDPLLQALRAACPVCGQQGPRDMSARTQCTACLRPWTARAA